MNAIKKDHVLQNKKTHNLCIVTSTCEFGVYCKSHADGGITIMLTWADVFSHHTMMTPVSWSEFQTCT